MILYKLKKVLKQKCLEILSGSGFLAFVASFIPFAPFLFLRVDDFSLNEKKQMIFVSLLCLSLDLFMIHSVDIIFNYNIIASILLGSAFSFLFFFIPVFIVILWFEISEVILDKEEIREAKINTLFRKIF